MAPVHIQATHVVRHATDDSTLELPRPFHLGPLDQLGSIAIPICAVWIYEATSSHPLPVTFNRLRRAIVVLLDYYPHLTGRLDLDSETAARLITRLQIGTSLVEATCDAPLSSFRDATTNRLSVTGLPDSGVTLLPPWDASEQGAKENPLLSFQHTRFACGSAAVGVRLSRVVAGAGGFLELYRNLAEIYQAIGDDEKSSHELQHMPCITPFTVAEGNTEASKPEEVDANVLRNFGYSVTRATEGQAMPTSEPTAPPPAVTGREILFTASELAALKARAMPTDGVSWISTFSALSAHIWQRTQLARRAAGRSTARTSAFFTSVDFSRKLSLPPYFFPASVVTPCIEQSVDDLCGASLREVAKAIHDMTHDVSAQGVRELAAWVAAQPRKQDIMQNVMFRSEMVITTAWNTYSMYAGADMDVEPAYAGVPFTPTNLVDGLAFFLQPKTGGGLVVALALAEDVWEALYKDEEFKPQRE